MSKIMIVEDDPMISEIYNKKFSEAGFEVVLAGNGKQALEKIKKEEVDVILTDLVMPEMDGFELVKTLRSGDYKKDIKIIVLSNLVDSKEEVLKSGADFFLAKFMFVPTEIVAKVNEALNQK